MITKEIFVYNGKVLENDMLKDFEVTLDEHKIKLKVIQQLKQGEELETLETN